MQTTTQHTEDELLETLSPKIRNRLHNLLQEDYVSEQQAEEVKEFTLTLDAVSDDKIGDSRIEKYLSQFSKILPHADYPLKDADIRDIQLTLNKVDKEDISATTKRDRRVCLSKFYRTMFEIRTRPERIWDILESEVTDTSHPGQKDRERQYDFILPDEVMELSEVSKNRRDQLLPLFLYCTGARHDEVRRLKIKHFTRMDTHYSVKFDNQKNENLPPTRTVYPTRLTHYIREWLEQHPNSDDPEAYFFCTLQKAYHPETGEQTKEKGDKLSRRSMNKILEKLAERTGLEKRHNAHAFRYCMATFHRHLADDFDIIDIMERGGWGSEEQVRKYILEIDEIENKRRKEKQGIETNIDERLEALDKRTCGNCGKTSPPTRDLCKCGHALSNEIAREHAEKEVVMVERNEKGLGAQSKL